MTLLVSLIVSHSLLLFTAIAYAIFLLLSSLASFSQRLQTRDRLNFGLPLIVSLAKTVDQVLRLLPRLALRALLIENAAHYAEDIDVPAIELAHDVAKVVEVFPFRSLLFRLEYGLSERRLNRFAVLAEQMHQVRLELLLHLGGPLSPLNSLLKALLCELLYLLICQIFSVDVGEALDRFVFTVRVEPSHLNPVPHDHHSIYELSQDLNAIFAFPLYDRYLQCLQLFLRFAFYARRVLALFY